MQRVNHFAVEELALVGSHPVAIEDPWRAVNTGTQSTVTILGVHAEVERTRGWVGLVVVHSEGVSDRQQAWIDIRAGRTSFLVDCL